MNGVNSFNGGSTAANSPVVARITTPARAGVSQAGVIVCRSSLLDTNTRSSSEELKTSAHANSHTMRSSFIWSGPAHDKQIDNRPRVRSEGSVDGRGRVRSFSGAG